MKLVNKIIKDRYIPISSRSDNHARNYWLNIALFENVRKDNMGVVEQQYNKYNEKNYLIL